MFTGLVADIGRIEASTRQARGLSLRVATGLDTADFTLGESVAVNGACLTVTAFRAGSFDADVSAETVARTAIGALRPGDAVHLERALRVGDRLGGHFVQGHVDGVGRVERSVRDGDAWVLTIAVESALASQLVEKGSVAVDGVSLTVNGVSERSFSLTIVPFTAASTTLADAAVGRRVNIETDVLGKYVRAAVQGAGGTAGGSTWELLQRYGYTGQAG
jgi:riboflavin synthase